MSTSVDDETILEVLRSNDAPRMTTTEVAGHLPVTRGTTRSRLQALVDDDLLERKTEGNNVVWWLPERTDELDAWEAEQATGAGDEPTEATADESTEAMPEEHADADGDDGSDEDAAVGEESAPDVEADEPLDTAGEDESTDADDDDSAVDEMMETRTASDRPDLSQDEEGLRALALLAAVLTLVLLLRKLRGGAEEQEEEGAPTG